MSKEQAGGYDPKPPPAVRIASSNQRPFPGSRSGRTRNNQGQNSSRFTSSSQILFPALLNNNIIKRSWTFPLFPGRSARQKQIVLQRRNLIGSRGCTKEKRGVLNSAHPDCHPQIDEKALGGVIGGDRMGRSLCAARRSPLPVLGAGRERERRATPFPCPLPFRCSLVSQSVSQSVSPSV
jgi:hypothetical protein